MATTHEKQYKFKVDDKQYEDERSTITGSEIRQIAEVPAAYQLFLEVHGQQEDKLIGGNDVVNLAEPGIEKFYTLPPANFGHREPH